MNRYTQIYINSYVNKDLEQTKTAGVKAPKIDFGKIFSAAGTGLKRFGVGTAKSPVVQGLAAKAVVPDVAKAVGVDPVVADELGTGAMVGLASRGKFPYTKGPLIRNPLLNVAAGVGAGLFSSSSDRKIELADAANANKPKMEVPLNTSTNSYNFDNISPYDPPAPSKLYDYYDDPVPNPPFTLSPYSED